MRIYERSLLLEMRRVMECYRQNIILFENKKWYKEENIGCKECLKVTITSVMILTTSCNNNKTFIISYSMIW